MSTFTKIVNYIRNVLLKPAFVNHISKSSVKSNYLIYLSFGVLIWTLVYFYMCRRMSYWTNEAHCRIIAVLHALLVVNMCAYSMFVQGPNVLSDLNLIGTKNTYAHNVIALFSLSYFIFDLIWSLVFQTEAPVMLLHHILSIFGTSYSLFSGYLGPELMATIFGSELTNPLVQLRWFLYEAGLHKSWLAELNTAFFISLFVTIRIGLGSWFMYNYMFSVNPSRLAKFGCTAFYLVSVAFTVNIGMYARKHYISLFREQKARIARRKNRQKKAEEAKKDAANSSMMDSIDADILEEEILLDTVMAAKAKKAQSRIVDDMFLKNTEPEYEVEYDDDGMEVKAEPKKSRQVADVNQQRGSNAKLNNQEVKQRKSSIHTSVAKNVTVSPSKSTKMVPTSSSAKLKSSPSGKKKSSKKKDI